MRRAWCTPILLAGLAFSGCASADRGQARGSVEEHRDVHAVPVHGWQVRVTTAGDEEVREGELLAVDEERIYVLQYGPHRVWTAPRLSVDEVRLDLYPHRGGAFAGWFVTGLASTLSHGWLSIGTAPLWVLSGIASITATMVDARIKLGQSEWGLLHQYARFPAGPPPGLL
ncbi:MAG: hypothetical protein ACOC5B_02215, partial [Myxococcota bacterium]